MAEAEGQKGLKIAVMGGGGVGKSNLSLRFIQGRFVDNYDPTIEDSYFNPNFSVDGVTVPLEILDTAGQDEFQMMMDIYYKTADCFVFVYSITDRNSVEDVKNRYEACKQVRDIQLQGHTSGKKNKGGGDVLPPMILVGNKVDLEESRVVTKAEGEALAREMGEGVNFEETSAKADINVTKVFEKVAREAFELKKKTTGKTKKDKCVIQ